MNFFNKINTFPIQFYTLIDGTESIEMMTFGEFFGMLRSEHFHSKGDVKCPFHDESVADHLLECAKLCEEMADEYEVDKAEAYFTGLFHDIGKPGTLKVDKKRISFKGHSIVGAGMMENFYSPLFEAEFGISRTTWSEMSYAVSMHMCDRENIEGIAMDSYRLLPIRTRRLLALLRIADDRSRITSKERIDPALTQAEYVKNITTDFSMSEFCEKYGLNDGVLVQIHGNSNAGKTSLAKALAHPNDLIVSRDDVMVEIVNKARGISKPYGEYSADEYSSAYDFYNKNKKLYAGPVNEKMKDMISRGLVDGKVVFVDSMAISFMYSAQAILPITNSFKLSLWVNRSELTTTNRHITVQNQGKVSLPNSKWNPYCEFDWHAITPMHESGDFNADLRPHIGLSVSWNSPLAFIENTIASARNTVSSLVRLPTIDSTQNLTLPELVSLLSKRDSIFTFFKYHHYTVSKVFESDSEYVLTIKYIDGINNLWSPVWARQARGMVLHLDRKTHCVKILKCGPSRGVELLTEAHLSNEITETQDYTSKDDSFLDETQRELNRKLAVSSSEINGILTSKVDGSLLLVTLYSLDSPEAKIVRNIAPDDALLFTHSSYLGVISTQGTLFIGGGMKEYFLTAIAPAVTGGELISNEKKPEKIWNSLKEKFATYFFDRIDVTNNATYAFEMVCKNRTDYLGFTHNELAISYNDSFIHFLGMKSHEFASEFIPHFAISHKFDEPMCIHVKTSKDLVTVLIDWNEVVFDRISISQFCEKYGVNVPKYIDAEGFVLYTSASNIRYNYSKTKLPIYYKLHKIRSHNIDEIRALPSSVEKFFPNAGKIKRFFSHGQTQLEELYTRGIAHLTKIATDSSRNFNLNEKILANRKNPATFTKILLNNKSCANEVYSELRSIVDEVFGASGRKIDESYLRNIFMNGVNRECINELYTLYE